MSDQPDRAEVISALRNAALGILVFFLLDAAIFRSGLYLSVVEPVSILGTELAALRRIEDASATAKPIVVIGDSRVGEGFFTKIANLQAEQAHSRYRFANASAAGSRLESQYYLLRTADPNADRFSAVVVMLETYQSSFWVTTQCRDELPFIHAFARITDYLDIARNCADFDDSMNTLTSLAVAAPNFRADLIAFLSGIRARLSTVAAWRQHGTEWVNTRLGIDHDVIGLSYDAGYPDPHSAGASDWRRGDTGAQRAHAAHLGFDDAPYRWRLPAVLDRTHRRPLRGNGHPRLLRETASLAPEEYSVGPGAHRRLSHRAPIRGQADPAAARRCSTNSRHRATSPTGCMSTNTAERV